ncbi:MAG: hypothetical protein WDN26_08980 [Chitinophagaceae bacterium]
MSTLIGENGVHNVAESSFSDFPEPGSAAEIKMFGETTGKPSPSI